MTEYRIQTLYKSSDSDVEEYINTLSKEGFVLQEYIVTPTPDIAYPRTTTIIMARYTQG